MLHRTFFSLAAAALLAAVSLPTQARPGNGHVGVGVGFGHHFAHRSHWHIGVGVGFGYWPYYAYPYPYYGWAPGYAVVEQPVAVERVVPAAPAPVFTPQRGQDAAQLESDRRRCDREAMAQPAAMADAGIFHRVVLVCMENRGYAIR